MRRLGNDSFKKSLGFLAVLSVLLTMFIALVFFLSVKKVISLKFTASYLDIEGLSLSGGLAVISPGDFEKHFISGTSIGAYFLRNVRMLFVSFALVQGVLVILLCIGVWRIYKRMVEKPLDELASSLENWEYSGETEFSLPEGFQRLKAAVTGFERKMNQVYSDFRYLGAYVSHEYKNAMALLRARVQNGNTETLFPVVDSLVKDMDDILTLCTHGGEESPHRIDLALVCAKAVDEFIKVHSQIHFYFDEERDIGVWGNKLWIYRAVCNLLDNAVKYGKGKRIDVTVGICHDCPFLEIKDYGEGIEPGEREKIFRDGYRVTAMKRDGHGIGLSLVRHVASLSGAYLWVKSGQGRGTSFKMVFPPEVHVETAAAR